jgi:hypothetical protein
MFSIVFHQHDQPNHSNVKYTVAPVTDGQQTAQDGGWLKNKVIKLNQNSRNIIIQIPHTANVLTGKLGDSTIVRSDRK